MKETGNGAEKGIEKNLVLEFLKRLGISYVFDWFGSKIVVGAVVKEEYKGYQIERGI